MQKVAKHLWKEKRRKQPRKQTFKGDDIIFMKKQCKHLFHKKFALPNASIHNVKKKAGKKLSFEHIKIKLQDTPTSHFYQFCM